MMAEWTTHAGRRVRVRPLVPEDAAALVELFAHLGAESRLRRFNVPLEDAPQEEVWREAVRLASVPPEEGAGWLAETQEPGQPPEPLGVVRFQRLPPDTAEVGIVVRDDAQGMGIGAWLLRWVAAQAAAAGIRKLVGLVRQENAPVQTLLARSPYPTLRLARGTYDYVEVELTGET